MNKATSGGGIFSSRAFMDASVQEFPVLDLLVWRILRFSYCGQNDVAF
jgi:hypothetical protein